MAMTLITTNISSGAASSSFTSDIDNTYKLYIFKFYDVNPVTDNVHFTVQFNRTGESGYNETITAGYMRAIHPESDSEQYISGGSYGQGQGTDFQPLAIAMGNDADQSAGGELYLFNPSNTVYATHFYSRFSSNHYHDYSADQFVGGYINTAPAIVAVQFKMASGNMDAVIKMYGVG